ncbi:hypothetical protein BDV23DRAFT_184451 [Aspergillus alliaceus]|uniref:Uncharacterized protein n=1 Tax=Petromyces alliaceus TaxID=209559 RepID=A0A5N7C6Y1_PETAA|nr:hypothetical protein BDV23DRAFT_184451 [Aspergillus alliaceus]
MTAFERQVSPLKGYNGERIQDPPTLSKSATALDYLCAANGHSLPGTASFEWNWVLPKDINNISGVIAVKREIFAGYLRDELVSLVAPYCIELTCTITDYPEDFDNPAKFNLDLKDGQTPDIASASGNEISYSATGYQENGYNGVTGEVLEVFKVVSTYKLNAKFSGETVTVSHHLCFSATVR